MGGLKISPETVMVDVAAGSGLVLCNILEKEMIDVFTKQDKMENNLKVPKLKGP